jgi:hypothetical protein
MGQYVQSLTSMNARKIPIFLLLFGVVVTLPVVLFSFHKRTRIHSRPVDLKLEIKTPFRFVAYGDTRFHDPTDHEAANPAARVALVQAIADANPAFIGFSGDVVFNGFDTNDWRVWDQETSVWRDKKIPVYPALGNHELRGDVNLGLRNYFEHFPDLKGARYYSVRAANVLLLALDSSQEEVSGDQGDWLANKLNNVPSEVDFVFIILHHPTYTSSKDGKLYPGGHAARPEEQALGKLLEDRQAHARFRIVVVAGHVHNYERHEHGGVTYFVSGGGGAHPYLIDRAPTDLFQGSGVNYHYLTVDVDKGQVAITMNRWDLVNGNTVWTQPDSVKIALPAAVGAAAGH